MFTFINKSRIHLSHPFTSKNWGKREENPKKMRNLMGSIDCIDKLKHALRQSLKQ